MIIKKWLEQSNLDRLDGLLLLSFVLGKPKEWLLAHDDLVIKEPDFKKLHKLKARRLNNEPMAYILGKKEFYGRNFDVNPDVLIPRPETENLVEYILEHVNESHGFARNDNTKILDVGTGSGCIAITLKLENPKLDITASDISDSALKTAKQNWQKLGNKNQTIKFVKSDLLGNIEGKFDIIVANLPYVSKTWQTSIETKHEPYSAIFAKENGLLLIKKLVESARNFLNPNAILALELDPRSVNEIKNCCENYNIIYEEPFILVLQLETAR